MREWPGCFRSCKESETRKVACKAGEKNGLFRWVSPAIQGQDGFKADEK
jgi:hypothetical protein